jgi:hypothetical protein
MKSKYNCSRVVLYLILRMIAANLRANIAAFTTYKGFYIIAYCTALDSSINSCEGLPTEAEREAAAILEHKTLAPLRKTSCQNFMDLERYAASTWADKEVLAANLKVAGKDYYADASNNNWASVKEMNRLGSLFLTANSAAMEAGLNMPIAFIATFASGGTAFSNGYSSFKTSQSGEPAQQVSKMEAENALWDQCVDGICGDGVAIARGNEVFADLFTVEEIKQLVATGGGSGVKGNCYTGVAKLPVEGVTVSIPELDKSFPTDVDGKFRSPAIAHGTYGMTFICPGYVPVTLAAVEINIHTFKTLHIEMIPLAEAAAKAAAAKKAAEAAKAEEEKKAAKEEGDDKKV